MSTMNKQAIDNARLLVAMRFPCGISYKDWEQLSDIDKQNLWKKRIPYDDEPPPAFKPPGG